MLVWRCRLLAVSHVHRCERTSENYPVNTGALWPTLGLPRMPATKRRFASGFALAFHTRPPMRNCKFPLLVLAFFLGSLLLCIALDVASRLSGWPGPTQDGYWLLLLVALQMLTAAWLAYDCSRAADAGALRRVRVVWRFAVLALAALAAWGVLLALAIAVLGQRG